MGRLGQNPSSRGYATPTYATTPLTARETFGGTSKAGLGRHIGMGPFTYGAIVNGSGGHQASFLAGNSFPAAFRAGQLLDMKYPISDTNQLARVGTGTTGGMTRTPADGVNLNEREEMQTRVDKWNKVWPAMPQRDTPNGCCKSIPHLNQDDDHTNITANEQLYGLGGFVDSGPFGDIHPPKYPIGVNSDADPKVVKFTNMPSNGLQGVSFYNLLYGQCKGNTTPNQFDEWGISYITNKAIYTFVKEQGFNCIRFPLTVWPKTDYGGDDCNISDYTTYFDKDGNVTDKYDHLIKAIIYGVSLAAHRGLYSIIDWHTYGKSTDGQNDINGAVDPDRTPPTGWEYFFYNFMKQISASPDANTINNYLIWEIFNEPIDQWDNWNSGDYAYPKTQIDTIRKYEEQFLNTQHLIIIGTNFYSQLKNGGTLPLVSDDATNICFALHFYTMTHNADMIGDWGFQQNEAKVGVVKHDKLDKYFPVFISECGPTSADGKGGPDYDGSWESVLAELGLWVNGSTPGQVQPGQPIVVWALTGLDTEGNKSQVNVLINEKATADEFTPNENMNKLVKSFFGQPSKGIIPTWCALAGAYVPALDPTAAPNGRKWLLATNTDTAVNKFVSNFTTDTITIGPVQGVNDPPYANTARQPNSRYTSRQLFLWDDASKPLYISYKMNLNDIYCNNSAVFFLIFPNSNCRTPASQQPPGATKNYCDAPATGPTYGRCQELDLMETDGKYYFASTWHPLTSCDDANSDSWYSTYSLFSGRTSTPQNFIANILPNTPDWDSSFYLQVKHRFTQNSQGRAIWEVEFNNSGTWYQNYTNGIGANNPAVEQQLFKSLGGGSDENTADTNGAGFRLILGINKDRPVKLTDAWDQGGDTGSSSWNGSTIDGFTCDCSKSQGNADAGGSYNVGMQAWYLQDIKLDNVTTISADLITQDNIEPYLAPQQTVGTGSGLLPHTS